MRIAIDLQGVQSEGSRTRGIGRYSLEVIKNIIKEHPEDEIILVANSLLFDIRLDLKNYIDNGNVTYLQWYSPAPYDYVSMDKIKTKLAIFLRSYVFNCLHVDIILITSYFEGFSDNCCVDFDYDILDVPTVAIFYDLIPLINPDLYLNNNPDFEKYYRSKIKKIRNLDGLLAISNSALKEAKKHLRYHQNKIFNISSACDKKTFNTFTQIETSNLIDVSDYTPFILYSGANDPRKNVKSLLEAYSLLPMELRTYKLVLVGKLLKAESELLNSWIKLFNIDSDKIVHIGYVTDFDLVELYRKCSLFVFPSLHEGFGLPVLEAMCCGAPVIGSNTTSIPEVIELESAMFDPKDVDQISNLITRALLDKNFNYFLKANSIKQSQKFSWKSTAKAAVNACKIIIDSSKPKSHLLDWKTISINNIEQLNLLIQKLNKFKLFRKITDEEFHFQVAASIDKNTSELDNLARKISTKNNNLSWRIEGPIDSSYSLAILNRCFINSMHKLIDNLSIHITEGPGDYEPNLPFLSKYTEIYSLYKNSLNSNLITDVVSRNLYPPRVHDLSSKFNLLHCYGWEESEFPSNWVDDFNSYLQGITVMSSQVKKILIDNGVCIPIQVTGLGLDHLDSTKDNELDRGYNLDALDVKNYKILHISSCFPRKGIDILLKAYEKSFSINDDITLIIKTFDNPHNNVDQQIQKLISSNPLFPHVLLIKKDLTDQEIKALFLKIDMLVAPSRGEGFGLPIGEAMRIGVPVVTTNWGGQLDFCNEDNSWLIDYDFVPSKSHFNLDSSYWAEPSVDHLSYLLRQVYDANPKVLKKKTLKAKEEINNFTWDEVAKNNLNFVNNELSVFNNHKTQLGCITTWNSKCGIASYSKNLFKFINDEVLFFTPYDEELSPIKGEKVFPSWDDQDKLLDLAQRVFTSNITSLVIQFNYGFFDFECLSKFINTIYKRDINIFIILHSTIDPEDDHSKKLSLLFDAFSKCQRLIVHTISDLNRLKKIGLIDNVCLLPHPLLCNKYQYKKIKSIDISSSTSKTLNIGSYGFCLPNKGFKELILATNLLIKKGLNINLSIYSAIYNQNYQSTFDELIDLVNTLNLSEFVTINSKYMTDNQSLDLLSHNDYLIFPYQFSNESSSAAVRYGLSTLRPVLVTPLPIFDDVSDLVHRLKGFSPQDIANGILNVIESANMSRHYTEVLEAKKIDLINNRSFSKVSQRLFKMIKSLEIN
ncbi:glycosyltransferase [Prochlorococcus marinus]|uniref:glycosyltransferase n=1 Tax=Prochlorococcus marinus TaxID=1219 RepID=UPI0022B406D6|nr:glycosyltransferase [Prochlorococcus marinus]